MNIRNKNDIKVYNEMPTQINLVGQHRNYIFPPATDGVPSMNLVDFSDIEYAHSRGIVFSSGLLVFDKEERDEIYRELRINDWEDKVWFEADIDNAIKHPTLESMQRIVDITNLILIERFRGKVVYCVNKNIDISNKVVNIVNTRYKEISAGIMKSRIVLKPSDTAVNAASEKKIADLEQKIQEMSEMMMNMSSNSSTSKDNEPEDNEVKDTVDATAKKSSGRKKSAAKQD